MVEQIGNQVILWKAVAGILGAAIPLTALLVWKKKDMSIRPAVVGAITFFVFSQILEGIPKTLFFVIDSGVSRYIWAHAWAYVLIGCLLAGIFEEVGRYVAFRFFLKKQRDRRDAITYGIGHGGIESILFLTLGAFSSISLIFVVNGGLLEQSLTGMSAAQLQAVELQVSALAGYGPAGMLVDVFERMVAITLHISLSVIVFRAVESKKGSYLVLAIMLHALFDVPAALYQCGVTGMGLTEAWLFVSAIGCVYVATKFWKKGNKEE